MTNQAVISGAVRDNPVQGAFENGVNYTCITVRVVSRTKGNPDISYIDVIATGVKATYVDSELSAGDNIVVVGRLSSYAKQNKDGSYRKRTFIRPDIINKVEQMYYD